MKDTNLVIVLTNNTEIKVMYPACIGREYNTRDEEWHREWNIDVNESLLMRISNPSFIVGKWGTPFGSEDFTHRIPFTSVARFKDLHPDDQVLADRRLAEERQQRIERIADARLITHSEFKLLEDRVARLENPYPYPHGGPSLN